MDKPKLTSYWEYTFSTTGKALFAFITGVAFLFWIYWTIDEPANLTYDLIAMAIILGVPLIVFFVGNYLKWKQEIKGKV